ncbi:MAG: histidine kinase dimerization/phospho-acceptor domain-containing protein, partial [Pseudomonadota bacterium]
MPRISLKKRFSAMSLKKQMVILAVSLIIVSSALNSYLAISSSIRAAEEQALSSALLFSESFAKAAEFGLYTESAPELATAADLISRVPTIAGVSVLDTDGNEIYQEVFRALSDQQLKNVRNGIESLQLSPLGGSHTIRHTRPVYASTFGDIEGDQEETARTKLGDVALLFEFSPIREELRGKVLLTLVTAIAIVFAISLLAYGLAGRLLRPVYDVMVGLRDVSEGNFSHKVNSEAGGELRKLVDGFNVMVDGLRHYRNETVRARDVLEQRVEERTQALLEEKERAESANRTKSEFLARMSHEIRTPMNGVLGMTELLLTSELSASDRRYAETIRNSGTALLHIINDILDFSKIEAGKMELECTQISIRSVAEDVGHMLA